MAFWGFERGISADGRDVSVDVEGGQVSLHVLISNAWYPEGVHRVDVCQMLECS